MHLFFMINITCIQFNSLILPHTRYSLVFRLEKLARYQFRFCRAYSQGRTKESEVAQLCLTLCKSMDCGSTGSSVHGIFQAKIPEWAAISFYNSQGRVGDKSYVEKLACNSNKGVINMTMYIYVYEYLYIIISYLRV